MEVMLVGIKVSELWGCSPCCENIRTGLCDLATCCTTTSWGLGGRLRGELPIDRRRMTGAKSGEDAREAANTPLAVGGGAAKCVCSTSHIPRVGD